MTFTNMHANQGMAGSSSLPRPAVRFDVAPSQGGDDSRAPFLPDSITDGATGNTYSRDPQGGFILRSTRQQEKSREFIPADRSARSFGRGRSASPHREASQPTGAPVRGSSPRQPQPATVRIPPQTSSAFTLPPITSLMSASSQQVPPPIHQTIPHPAYTNSYLPAAPLSSSSHSHTTFAPAQDPSRLAYAPPIGQQLPDGVEMARTVRRKPTLADPRKAVVGSLFNPFRARTGGCNPKYAHELRHNNWARWTPIGGFAPRYNSDGLSEALSSGDALLLESGAGSVSLKAKGFTEIPIEDTDRADFTGIASNLPRAIREHLIPAGELDVGSEHALAIADMFQGLFRMIQDREDFHECFELYREYVWKVIRAWHSYPEDNIRIDIFHVEMYQQILHGHLARETSCKDRASSNSSSSSTYTAHHSNQNQQSFRNPKNSRGSKAENYRRSEQPKTKGIGDDNNVCYKCGGTHHHSRHKASASDYLVQKGRNWVDPEGRCYCIGFNGISGCSFGKDCKYEHRCGRCGSTDHSSQNHRG